MTEPEFEKLNQRIARLEETNALLVKQVRAMWGKFKETNQKVAEARQHVDAMAGHGIGAAYRAPETIRYVDGRNMPMIASTAEAARAIRDMRIREAIAPVDDGSLLLEDHSGTPTPKALEDFGTEDKYIKFCDDCDCQAQCAHDGRCYEHGRDL